MKKKKEPTKEKPKTSAARLQRRKTLREKAKWTISEASEYTKIPRSSIERWIREDLGMPTKSDGVVDAKSVRIFVKKCKTKKKATKREKPEGLTPTGKKRKNYKAYSYKKTKRKKAKKG